MPLALASNQDGAAIEAAPYVIVELPGPPRGKSDRLRIITQKGTKKQIPIRYLDADTRAYMGALTTLARIAMRGRPLLHGPVAVGMLATLPVPKSWSERDRANALSGVIVPTAKPDWDNIGKMTDAFKTVVWGDDASVAQCLVVKQYGERPSLVIEVFRIKPRAPLFEA